WKINASTGSEVSVAEFVFEELEGLDFETRYKYAYDFIKSQPEPQDSKFYLQNEDPKIAAMALELLATPYELSEGWLKKYQVLVPDQQKILSRDILSAIMRLKQYHNFERLRQVEKMIQLEQEKPQDEQD